MNQADIVKIKEHFEPLMGDKTLIIMRDEASVFTGKSCELEKYKIYTLDRSIGPNNIKNDELFQKVKPKVYESAGGSKEEALIKVYNSLKEMYPHNHVNVFVWEGKAMNHSGWKNCRSWTSFKLAEDAGFGHDFLIILN